MSLDFLRLEFVGADQRRHHVDADQEGARRIEELDDHRQILRKPMA
jgi:hypothetical protein